MSGGAAWLPVVARIAMPLGQSTVYSYATPRPRNVTEPASLRKKGASQSLADATLDERKPQTRAAEVPRCILSDAASNCGEGRAEIDSLSRASPVPRGAWPGGPSPARLIQPGGNASGACSAPTKTQRNIWPHLGETVVSETCCCAAWLATGAFACPRQSLYTRSVERGASVRRSIGFRGPY